jgi:hypothetical protein
LGGNRGAAGVVPADRENFPHVAQLPLCALQKTLRISNSIVRPSGSR